MIENLKKELNKTSAEHSAISLLYYRLFFGFLISENELQEILENLKKEFEEDPENWFVTFHKMIRQTDFFSGCYVKTTNKLTPEQNKIRHEIIHQRIQFRKDQLHDEPPFFKELQELNKIANTEEHVPVPAFADTMLYGLINLDSEDVLKNVLERVFKS